MGLVGFFLPGSSAERSTGGCAHPCQQKGAGSVARLAGRVKHLVRRSTGRRVPPLRSAFGASTFEECGQDVRERTHGAVHLGSRPMRPNHRLAALLIHRRPSENRTFAGSVGAGVGRS